MHSALGYIFLVFFFLKLHDFLINPLSKVKYGKSLTREFHFFFRFFSANAAPLLLLPVFAASFAAVLRRCVVMSVAFGFASAFAFNFAQAALTFVFTLHALWDYVQ